MHFRIYNHRLKLLTIIILSTEMNTFFFLQNIIIYQQIKQFIYLYETRLEMICSILYQAQYILSLSLFKIIIIQKS